MLIGALIGAFGKERIYASDADAAPGWLLPSCDAYGWRYEQADGVAVSLVVSSHAGGEASSNPFNATRPLGAARNRSLQW